MHTSIFYSCLLLLLLILLAINVSRYRVRYQIFIGDGGRHKLQHAIRAHGNSVEQILPFILLLLFLDYLDAHENSLHILSTLFLITRGAYAVAMLKGPILFRQISSGLTTGLQLGALTLVLVQLWRA